MKMQPYIIYVCFNLEYAYLIKYPSNIMLVNRFGGNPEEVSTSISFDNYDCYSSVTGMKVILDLPLLVARRGILRLCFSWNISL